MAQTMYGIDGFKRDIALAIASRNTRRIKKCERALF